MKIIHFVELENFKQFGDKTRIELDHPSVLIGPNNCGKTSALQAIALWSQAFKAWYSKKGTSKSKKRSGVALNRLEIVSVPVPKTRYFWSNLRVRRGENEPIHLYITVGLEFNGKVIPLSMDLYNDGDDQVYCAIDEERSYQDLKDEHKNDFHKFANGLKVELLYPMSGLSTEEGIYQDKLIHNLMGQGRTAEVLRNLCLKIDAAKWHKIQALMTRLFQIKLEIPQENSRGYIELLYSHLDKRERFEISATGRGFQQVLLIFAYLYSYPGSILLVDEPDAHLEILRQKQIYILLRDIAEENGSQVILVTHSEVVLDEAADNNLTLILKGSADNLSKKPQIRSSLNFYGTANYVKAVDRGYILFVEGRTDIDILREYAKLLNHGSAASLDDRLNVYYTQNNFPDQSMESELSRVESSESAVRHFSNLRSLLQNLRGLCLRDNDGQNRVEVTQKGLPILYWSKYELENFFVTPQLLKAYVIQNDRGGMFEQQLSQKVDDVLEPLIMTSIFDGNEKDFLVWKGSSDTDAGRVIWDATSKMKKMSEFAEVFFRKFAEKERQSMLLRKGDLYKLVTMIDVSSVQDEITEKLDKIKKLISG